MNRLRFSALSLVLSFASACAPLSVTRNNYIDGRNLGKGTIVVSATRTGIYPAFGGDLWYRCKSGVSGMISDSHVLVSYIDGERVPIPIGSEFSFLPSRPGGRVHAIELPPGQCSFHAYSGGTSGAAVSTPKTFGIDFDVVADKVIYIGNFNTLISRNPVTSRAVASFSFSEKFERDVDLVKLLLPEFDVTSIERGVTNKVRW